MTVFTLKIRTVMFRHRDYMIIADGEKQAYLIMCSQIRFFTMDCYFDIDLEERFRLFWVGG